jgi:hypothetical protein
VAIPAQGGRKRHVAPYAVIGATKKPRHTCYSTFAVAAAKLCVVDNTVVSDNQQGE